QPHWPRGQKNELALMKNAGRIFEEEFEHESTSGAGRDKYRDVPGTVWRYRHFKIGGKVHRAKPSLVPKHTTPALSTGVDWFDMKRSLLAGIFLSFVAFAKTFTLEQVLSAPFPYELTAAPGGSRVAWVLNERGARNVWVSAAPDFKAMRWTNYT